MTKENLGLILDLYKEGNLERDSAISLIEDLAANKSQFIWTTPNYTPICTYRNDVPYNPSYTTFSNQTEFNNLKHYGDNQMPKVQM